MYCIMTEDMPRRYGLSWIANSCQLVVKIHKDLASHLPIVSLTAPIVEIFKEDFKFIDFIGDVRQNFGFENCMRPGPEQDGFISLEMLIPVIDRLTDEPCKECDGTGFSKDEWSEGEKCGYCSGKKRESFIDWHAAHAMSASLNTLFCILLLDIPEADISFETPPQLMTVELATTYGMGGYPLGGYYSKALAHFLSSSGVRPIPEMVAAMRSAYERMFDSNDDRFRACVDYPDGWLNVDCPGQACGLNPESHNVKKGEGYRFGSHNVESPMQQITLLAGLAALHDCADTARTPLK